MKAAVIFLVYLSTFAAAYPKHGSSGGGSAGSGKKTANAHSTNVAHTHGSSTVHTTGTATGSGTKTVSGTQGPSTGQSTNDPDPKNIWDACAAAPNCKVTTGKNGVKDIVMTGNANNRRRKAPKGSQTSSSKSSSSTSSSSDDGDKTTYKTYINYGDNKVEWGCEDDENGVDIPGMVAQAVDACKSASCVSDGWTKQITWVEPDQQKVAPFGKSATLTIVPSGMYDPSEHDYFAQAVKAYMGKGIQKWHQTHEEQKFKRDTNETDVDHVARDESPVLGPDPQTKCWLFTQTDQLSVNRFAYQDGNSLGGTQMTIKVTVSVDNGSGGFCSTITSTLGTLAGLIPDIGGALSAFFGIASVACSATGN